VSDTRIRESFFVNRNFYRLLTKGAEMATLIRVYDSLSDAQEAHIRLLESGFSASSVQLAATEDEAGPVEGNGVLDEKDTGRGPRGSGIVSRLLGSEERTDAYNSSKPIWRGCILLTVDADDGAQCTRAGEIMDSCGAIDVDVRTGRSMSPKPH
jgi:hypothetical protein